MLHPIKLIKFMNRWETPLARFKRGLKLIKQIKQIKLIKLINGGRNYFN